MTTDAQAALAQVRKALAAGPTPGEWACYDDSNDGKTSRIEIVAIGKTVARIYRSVPEQDLPNARLIAACSPANIAAILAHVDAQEAEIKRLRTRLEIDQRHPIDGIAARDATIREQDKEIERLRAALRWEQHRAERQDTHGDGCADWGPAHYECAIRERDDLKHDIAEYIGITGAQAQEISTLTTERDDHARWRADLADKLHDRETTISAAWEALRSAGVHSEATIDDGIRLLRRQLDEARAEREAMANVLPGVYYMDPPDGGDVSLLKQLQRMSNDAARYRLLRRKFAIISDGEGHAEFCAINLPRPTYIAPNTAIELDTALDRERLGLDGTRPPTPVGWSDTDWIKRLQEQDEQPHPLAGQHINQGSMDAAADAYEAEYNAARGIT